MAFAEELSGKLGFIYFLFGVSITFLGIAARAILPNIEAQKAMPMLLYHLLPAGFTGLIVATFLALAMSTADTALLVVSMPIRLAQNRGSSQVDLANALPA